VTRDQLAQNVRATPATAATADLGADLTQAPADYWAARSALSWG